MKFVSQKKWEKAKSEQPRGSNKKVNTSNFKKSRRDERALRIRRQF